MASADARRALVARLEIEAQRSPDAYRAKVLALAVIGYAALLTVLLASLGLPVVLVASALRDGADADPAIAFPVIFLSLFGVMLLRGVWIRFGAPRGYRLATEEAPELQAEVERLRLLVGAPPLHGIVIDSELNAAAATVPRLAGLLGHRYYLVLGLPLMQVLDREELSSVIAHEFGHFGEAHGRVTGWIYRVRLSWLRTLEAMSGSGSSVGLLLAFVARRYVAYFNAYSFVLARGNEYAADAAAVRAVGAEPAARALVRIEAASRRLQHRLWPDLLQRARAQRQPPVALHADMAAALRVSGDVDVPRLMIDGAREVAADDTHPTLAMRMQAMAVTPQWRRAQPPYADALLGDAAGAVAQHLDLQWRSEVQADWWSRHDAAAADRQRLDALERLDAPSSQALFERARLVESFHGGDSGAPWYRRSLDTDPGNAAAHYRLGLVELRHGDAAAGAAALEHAVARDDGVLPALMDELQALVADPYADPRIVALQARLAATHGLRIRSFAERAAVDVEDALTPHALDDVERRRLCELLALQPRVARAWIVRKGMDAPGEPPHHVLLLDWRGSVAGEGAGLEAVGKALPLAGSHTVFTGAHRRDLAKRVREVCGEPVYRKPRR